MTWRELDTILRANQTFLISSHVNPDGDCVGSQIAVAWYLESLGKQVTIYNADPVPTKFLFLQGTDRFTTDLPDGTFDVLISLDSSNLTRLAWEGAEGIAPTVVNIDHHRDNTSFGACNIVREASATGQILYHLFEDGGVTYPRKVAEALYVAVMTDTGGFRFSNTTSDVLRVCAALADQGLDPARLYDRACASTTRNGMRLHSRVWPTLAFHLDGRVCTMELPLHLVEEVGATYGDSEGLADLTVSADEVSVGVFIKHNDHQTHFSLRSKNHIDVGSMARRVPGGGGHVNAAGCTIEKPIDEAFPQMLAIIEDALE